MATPPPPKSEVKEPENSIYILVLVLVYTQEGSLGVLQLNCRFNLRFLS